MLAALKKGHECEHGEAERQARLMVEARQRDSEQNHYYRDNHAASEVDELDQFLNLWIVAISVLDQKPIATGVTDHVEEGPGDNEGRRQSEFARTKDTGERHIPEQGDDLGHGGRQEIQLPAPPTRRVFLNRTIWVRGGDERFG